MPQLFQVLKCFKCSVFQVHQTKKSNKWQCKLCGEKQSIKRHYGLGTGKECRLHVQKLNSVRGEVDKMNEMVNLNESSDEELPARDETNVLGKKEVVLKSKWSEFVDNTVNIIEPKAEPMCFRNAEVVLEIPAKRRKFISKSKVTKIDSDLITNPNKTADNLCSIQQSYESQFSNGRNNKPILKVVQTKDVQSNEVPTEDIKPRTKTCTTNAFVPLKTKHSKWAKFADEIDAEYYTDNNDQSVRLRGNENSTITNDTASPNNDEDDESDNEYVKKVPKNDMPLNIFSLCNESDIDNILDF